jgi:molecular chaperone GrpE
MTEDEFVNTEEEVLVVAPEAGPIELSTPEIAFVVPAPAYHSIATDEADEFVSPPSPGPDPVLEAMATLGDGLNRKLDALATVFDREIRAESTREKVVDRLHAELQEYKQGLLLGILRPVFVDLIQLHDDMGKMVAAQAEADGEVARLLALIRGFQQGIEDILYRQGVEPFTQPDDAFDPRRQRALSTVATVDPDRNKRVAARLRKGFQAGDKVIRPEMVTVYSYKERPATPADPARPDPASQAPSVQ